jgi:hypothetical protein
VSSEPMLVSIRAWIYILTACSIGISTLVAVAAVYYYLAVLG